MTDRNSHSWSWLGGYRRGVHSYRAYHEKVTMKSSSVGFFVRHVLLLKSGSQSSKDSKFPPDLAVYPPVIMIDVNVMRVNWWDKINQDWVCHVNNIFTCFLNVIVYIPVKIAYTPTTWKNSKQPLRIGKMTIDRQKSPPCWRWDGAIFILNTDTQSSSF